jgi:hypothetical protein
MSGLHDDFPPHAQAGEDAMLNKGATAYGVSQRGLANATPKQMEDWQWEEIRIQEELKRREYQKQKEQKERAELRDRFAMAALTGLLAAGDALAYNREEVAAETWKQADATLKARGDE